MRHHTPEPTFTIFASLVIGFVVVVYALTPIVDRLLNGVRYVPGAW